MQVSSGFEGRRIRVNALFKQENLPFTCVHLLDLFKSSRLHLFMSHFLDLGFMGHYGPFNVIVWVEETKFANIWSLYVPRALYIIDRGIGGDLGTFLEA